MHYKCSIFSTFLCLYCTVSSLDMLYIFLLYYYRYYFIQNITKSNDKNYSTIRHNIQVMMHNYYYPHKGSGIFTTTSLYNAFRLFSLFKYTIIQPQYYCWTISKQDIRIHFEELKLTWTETDKGKCNTVPAHAMKA